MADHTGAMGAGTTWADGDRVTGNITIGNGADVTVTAGATVTITGDYTITLSGTGKFVATGSAASRITLKSSASDPVKGAWAYIYFNCSSTGNSVQYCDLLHAGSGAQAPVLLDFTGAGAMETIQYNSFNACTTGVKALGSNTADITVQYNTFKEMNTAGVQIPAIANGGDFTIQNNFFLDCQTAIGGGILILDTAANTHTIQDNEFENCRNGIYINSVATFTITRNLFRICETALRTAGASNATITFDKNFVASAESTPSSGIASIYPASTAVTPALTLSNNIIGTEKHGILMPLYQSAATGQRITSSGNDLVGGMEPTASSGLWITDADNGSTSDNDFIAGNATAQVANVDVSESTTSTETPKQYQNLTSARTNARSAANYPLTIDTVSVTAQDQGAAFTWNSNRPMNSEIYLDRDSGVDPDDPDTYEVCYIRDDDWSTVKNSFTLSRGKYKDKSAGMIGTAHSVTVAGLIGGTTYYYVVRGVDPAGNVATAAEGNFKTTGSLGSTTVKIVPGQMVGVTPAKQLTKAAPVRFPLPKKKKYGKIERQ